MDRRTLPLVAILLLIGCALPVLFFLREMSVSGVFSIIQKVDASATNKSLMNSLTLVVLAGGTGTLLGWLLGTPLTLFSGWRKACSVAPLAMILLCPPFLWAVGIQGWKGFVPFSEQSWFDGFSGHLIDSVIVVLALVALTCGCHSRWLKRSTIEATRLSAGDGMLRWQLYRASFPLAIGSGLLGGLIVAGESGTGQMMGWQGFAGVIHSAFITEHNFQKAASRAFVLSLCLLPVAALAAWQIVRPTTTRLPSIDNYATPPVCTGLWLIVAAWIPLIVVLLGLLRPLWTGVSGPAFRDAWLTLRESIGATLELAVVTSVITAFSASLIGIAMVRSRTLWRAGLALGIIMLGLPQSIHGLGWLMLRNHLPILTPEAPASWETAVVLAMRWIPAASHFAALGWRTLPASSLESARLHGVSWWGMLRLSGRPVILNQVIPVAGVVALLSLGDASAIVLLQRPGSATFATRLFAIMDNAPEKQVAALCLVGFLIPLVPCICWIAGKRFFSQRKQIT